MGSQSSLVNQGALMPSSASGKYNQIMFAVQQALARMQTATMVRVESCTNDGGLSAVGYVDITPLVNQVDGEGKGIPHVTIYNVPYVRLQGGHNAVIMDPAPGDIGMAVFASRDLSIVKRTLSQANPGSYRQYDFADAMYIGGMLNGVPTQYLRFGPDGITITSPTGIWLSGPVVTVTGNLAVGSGASGTFTSSDGKTVTVLEGIVIGIA